MLQTHQPKLGTPRIGLVVVDDGLYAHRWVTPLLVRPDVNVAFTVCLSPLRARDVHPGGARGFLGASLARARYEGVGATARLGWRFARARLADAAFGSGLGGGPHSMASTARALGIPVLDARDGDVNSVALCSAMRALDPDLLVCAFPQRADAEFLQLPRIGCLGVHFSMLPRHCGPQPLLRALLSGEGAGVSVCWMAQGSHAGRVVCQVALSLDGIRTLHRAKIAACTLAEQVVPSAIFLALQWQGERADQGAVPGDGWPTRADIRAFRRAGFRFV